MTTGYAFPPADFQLGYDLPNIVGNNGAVNRDRFGQFALRIEDIAEQLSAGIYGERGTFTPVAEGATSAGTGTYEVQTGSYVACGSLLWFTLQLSFDNANHSGTGNLEITGFPFASDETTNAVNVFTVWDSQSGAAYSGIALMDPNTSKIYQIRDYAGNIQSIEANHELYITGTYRIQTSDL